MTLPTPPALAKPVKKKVDTARAWKETRELMVRHKRSLAIGFSLMIVNRLVSFVLPASSKFLIDDIILTPIKPSDKEHADKDKDKQKEKEKVVAAP